MLLVGHIIAIIAVFIFGAISRPYLEKASKKLRSFRARRTSPQPTAKN